MEMQSTGEAEKEFERARAALAGENSVEALGHLEKALKLYDNPTWYSYLGYCIAKERGQIKKGVELCLNSMAHDKDNPAHYHYLGKIHLISGNKEEALRVFREGMVKGGDNEIEQELIEFGMRKPPLFSRLPRGNPLNRYLGLILSRLGLR